MPARIHKDLNQIYKRLFKRFDPQHWWPGQTKFEIIVGAILTQNTNWTNVEKAIRNLKQKRVLHPEALRKIPPKKLAALIRPAGYFNVKTKRLKSFMRFFFAKYKGSIAQMGKTPLAQLRQELLSVNGIGPETADSILLYAFNKPVFVVDAYTKRFLYRHNFVDEKTDYHQIQELFMGSFDHNARLFNEYHALIVRLGKELCRPRPLCENCPLNDFHLNTNRI